MVTHVEMCIIKEELPGIIQFAIKRVWFSWAGAGNTGRKDSLGSQLLILYLLTQFPLDSYCVALDMEVVTVNLPLQVY